MKATHKPIGKFIRLASALMGIAAGISVQAASTLVTFSVDMAGYGNFTPGVDTIEAHGTFNGWGALTLVQQGSSTVYTNTANDTTDANGGQLQYKFVIGNQNNWESPAEGQNRYARLPATNGASLILPTAFFNDAGTPVANNVTFQVDVTEQIALGNFIPGLSSVQVLGWFNNWSGGVNILTNPPNVLVTNQYGYASTNVWVGTFSVVGSPGGADDFKYMIIPAGIWDSPGPVNQDGGGNRYFANVAQTLPVVYFSDQSTLVTLNVDLSAVVATDTNFNPASVTVNGDFNGWYGGISMTNNPGAANPNIYTAVVPCGMGSTINYQFRYNESSTGNIVYDLLNGGNAGATNRRLVVPSVFSTNVPAVLFNDATVGDYLPRPVPVTFSVDMTNAVGTDGHVFDPNNDNVYLNGGFIGWYSWGQYNYGSDPLAGFQMIRVGASTIYTNTVTVPAGTLVALVYKYGMAINGQSDALNFSQYDGPADDEAGFGVNHYRVIRATAIQPYALPVDKFGNQYGEPFLAIYSPGDARLAIGQPVSGKVPVTWLGRPGTHLQVKTNLVNGTWQDLTTTDGTNWTSGFGSTNGFVSQTNWPAGSRAFFRVVKP